MGFLDGNQLGGKVFWKVAKNGKGLGRGELGSVSEHGNRQEGCGWRHSLWSRIKSQLHHLVTG